MAPKGAEERLNDVAEGLELQREPHHPGLLRPLDLLRLVPPGRRLPLRAPRCPPGRSPQEPPALLLPDPEGEAPQEPPEPQAGTPERE